MNTSAADREARERVNPDDTIAVVGTIGRHRVQLEVRGLRDALAGASLVGLLDEYRRLSTPKQRQHVATLAYELADSMLAKRRARR